MNTRGDALRIEGMPMEHPESTINRLGDVKDGMRATFKVDGIWYACEDGTAEVTRCDERVAFAFIPDTVMIGDEACEVVSVGELAFSESMVSEVVLPKGLRRIGKKAFKGCRRLQTVVLPFAAVDPSAFEGCRALDTVAIVSGGPPTGYLGRITRPGESVERRRSRHCYRPLIRSREKKVEDGLPNRSLYDYAGPEGADRRLEYLCSEAEREEGDVDAVALMSVLSGPEDIDGAIAEMAMSDGSPFIKAMVLACGVGGPVDTEGALKML